VHKHPTFFVVVTARESPNPFRLRNQHRHPSPLADALKSP